MHLIQNYLTSSEDHEASPSEKGQVNMPKTLENEFSANKGVAQILKREPLLLLGDFRAKLTQIKSNKSASEKSNEMALKGEIVTCQLCHKEK